MTWTLVRFVHLPGGGYSRWISIANLALGILAIYLATALAT
jgi:hypothetical protein